MNIGKLIHQIKLRPEMFVGENYDFSDILNFLYGFMAAKSIYHLYDDIDIAFNRKFYAFVKDELERKYNICLNPCSEYGDFIKQVHTDSALQVKEFFDLADLFFQLIEANNLEYVENARHEC